MKKEKVATHRNNDIPTLESLYSMETTSDSHVTKGYDWLDWGILSLKLLIYVVGQTVAYLVEFGAVFFCLSAFYAIWSSLDDRKRMRDEPSAYSVFNPNCQEIDGAAEQRKGQMALGLF